MYMDMMLIFGCQGVFFMLNEVGSLSMFSLLIIVGEPYHFFW